MKWPGVEGALCTATLPESPQAAPVAGHSLSWAEREDLEPQELSSHTCARAVPAPPLLGAQAQVSPATKQTIKGCSAQLQGTPGAQPHTGVCLHFLFIERAPRCQNGD